MLWVTSHTDKHQYHFMRFPLLCHQNQFWLPERKKGEKVTESCVNRIGISLGKWNLSSHWREQLCKVLTNEVKREEIGINNFEDGGLCRMFFIHAYDGAWTQRTASCRPHKAEKGAEEKWVVKLNHSEVGSTNCYVSMSIITFFPGKRASKSRRSESWEPTSISFLWSICRFHPTHRPWQLN